MSKKGAGGGGGAKNKNAIKKVVEDKTFGMKNKNKSKKIQKFVANVEKSAAVGAKGGKKGGPELSEWDVREAKKKAKEAEKLELFLLGEKGGNEASVAQLVIVEPEEPEEEEIDPDLPIEEQIEIRRSRIKVHTPLTLPLFLDWKERKRLEKERQENEHNKRRKADITAGKVQRSGRELFEDATAQFEDDEEAVVAEEYITNDDETEAGFEISATGTSITLKEVAGVAPKSLIVEDSEGSSSSSSSSAPPGADVPVDAALFDDAGLDDLDDLE